MNKNAFFQRVLIFIFFIGILIITLVTTILITKKNVQNDQATSVLKRSCQITKNLLKKELSKPPVRFSSFFNVNSLFRTVEDYQIGYDSFAVDEKLLFKDLLAKINFIELNLKNRNSLPVFLDNISQYFFYPLNYIKVDKPEDLAINFKNAFLKMDFIGNRSKDSANAQKMLNYIYIEINPDKKILVLLSPPRDPDPLSPNNKRQAIIICFQKNENDLKVISSYIEKVKFANDE